jgi:hypothetical protein
VHDIRMERASLPACHSVQKPGHRDLPISIFEYGVRQPIPPD